MRSLTLAPAALALLLAAPARADLPPPDGQKFVTFSFTVKGLAAAPDRVLFAYPCGASNGAPMAEHRKIEEGRAIDVGRRGGPCTVYSVAKTTYEAWAKDYKPSNDMRDSALERLASQSQKCSGGPTPTYQIASKDPRSVVEQTLTVAKLDDASCVLTPVPAQGASLSGGAPAKGAPASAPASTAPASSTKSGCSTGGAGPGGAAAGLVGLLFAGLRLGRRRPAGAARRRAPG
jgi:MYXO-CTERM domain-containing protein